MTSRADSGCGSTYPSFQVQKPGVPRSQRKDGTSDFDLGRPMATVQSWNRVPALANGKTTSAHGFRRRFIGFDLAHPINLFCPKVSNPFKGLYATAREKSGSGEISRKNSNIFICLSVLSLYFTVSPLFSGSQSVFCGDFGWNSPKISTARVWSLVLTIPEPATRVQGSSKPDFKLARC